MENLRRVMLESVKRFSVELRIPKYCQEFDANEFWEGTTLSALFITTSEREFGMHERADLVDL